VSLTYNASLLFLLHTSVLLRTQARGRGCDHAAHQCVCYCAVVQSVLIVRSYSQCYYTWLCYTLRHHTLCAHTCVRAVKTCVITHCSITQTDNGAWLRERWCCTPSCVLLSHTLHTQSLCPYTPTCRHAHLSCCWRKRIFHTLRCYTHLCCHTQRRVAEGAAMLRTKGEAGTGNVVEAVRHARTVQRELRMVAAMDEDELFVFAKQIQVRSTPFCYTLQIDTIHDSVCVCNCAAHGRCSGRGRAVC
jgi:SOR/SNZ family